MKYLVLFFVLATAIFIACSSDNKSDAEKNKQIDASIVNNPLSENGSGDMSNLPVFKFASKNHDFGVIIEGEKVAYTFKFKNVGKKDLVISNAKGSCGCTVPKYDKQPIPPGKDGFIEIIFDSSGKNGNQSKTITISANTQPNTEVLTISGEVVKSNN